MGFKNFEEYEEYLRQQIMSPSKAAEIVKKGDAKVRTAMKELRQEALKEVVVTPRQIEGAEGYKVKVVQDEYGTKQTRYQRMKSLGEQLQDQLRKELTHCGDLKVIRNGHYVVVPRDYFDMNGQLLPSKRDDYNVLLAVLELAAGQDA